MDKLDMQKLNTRFLNFLRDYENKNILLDDINKSFTYEELINLLKMSSMQRYLTDILRTLELPENFQRMVDQLVLTQIDQGNYKEYMILISDNILLEYLADKDDEYDEGYVTLFKTDEAREKALGLKGIKKDSLKVAYILADFEDENLKIKHLNLVKKSEYDIVFASIKDKKMQQQIIEKYSKYCGKLISTLENEEMRVYYYERYFKKLNDSSKKVIFASFSEQTKEKYLDRYWKYLNDEEKTSQLALLTSEEGILKRLDKLTSDFSKVRLIDNLDKERIELISAIENTITYTKSKRLVKKAKLYDRRDIFSYLNIEKLFAKHTDKEKIGFIKKFGFEEKTKLSLLTTMKKISNIEKIINHYEGLPLYDESYNVLLMKYAEKYNLNVDHLIQIVKIFGLEILKNIKLDKFQNIINFDDVTFNKIIKLFDVDKYKMDNATLNDNINIFLQRKFKLQNPQIINISSDIRLAIQSGQIEQAINLFEKIISEYNTDEILKKYNYTREQFIHALIDSIDSEERVLNCLLEITKGYIVYKRNLFVQENLPEYYQKFSKQSLDIKSVLKFVVEYYPVHMIKKAVFNPKLITTKKGWSTDAVDFVNHPNALEIIIDFKRNPSNYNEVPEEIKKYMGVFNKIFEKLFRRLDLNIFDADIKQLSSARTIIDYDNLIDIFLTLDPDMLKNGILTDSANYETLNTLLEKYKLFIFDSSMKEAFATVDLDLSGYTLGNLINYFSIIQNELHEKIKNGEIKNITLPAQLDMAECYGSNSDKLSILFGKDNARLLSSNPGPNSASMEKQKRLKKAQDYLKTINKRTTISIPAYDKDFELSNGKKINVVVGNVSDPINLTYGERTGACMRIGGHADSLFDFCLTNDNGFHIRFNSPENDNFVSRVSGFRNGNTVFLNELRFSKDIEYSDEDIKEACILAAKEIIERSKNSASPIENVVVSPEYVMKNSETTSLNVSNIKKGLGKFYTDINENNATILATSNSDNSLVPIKLGNNGVVKYEVQRGKIRMFDGEKTYNQLARIELLDQFVAGIPIEEAEIKPKKDILFAYCGEDWYVSVDSRGNVNEYVMKNSSRKERAIIEKNECIKLISSQLSFYTNITKEPAVDNIGGVKK